VPAPRTVPALHPEIMAESLETGLILMVAGMGTVFVLLAVLVWLVGIVSRLSRWLEPAPAPAPAVAAPPPAAGMPLADRELVGVIGAAVKAHRDRHSAR
jgi:sodium pump decarboxylase gamma subunit